MGPYGLLTCRSLLRKLDLSCLTAGPLISSVNCHRLYRSGFYRHIPLPKSSRFTTISINSVWDNSTLGADRKITSGLSFDTSLPHTHTPILHYLMIRDGPAAAQWMIQTPSLVKSKERWVLNEFAHDESPSSGQPVFTAQSLNRAASLLVSYLSSSLTVNSNRPQSGHQGLLITPLSAPVRLHCLHMCLVLLD